MYTEIRQCRICKDKNLLPVLSLGEQYLSGVFPKKPEDTVTKGPLDLVWCSNCCLLQMKQSYNLNEMYGENYGYRSGLNISMVNHLHKKIRTLEKTFNLCDGDMVVDIGSNDGTSLKAYKGNLIKIGVDPTGNKFKEFYPDDIFLISDFYSSKLITDRFPKKKAKIITSIAMFYDLESPDAFVKEIEKILADEGIWHFEQSYMPRMLRTVAYDTICHEHLEFYSLTVVRKLLEDNGLRIIDVQINEINGGSFSVTACKKSANYSSNESIIDWLLKQENDMGLNTISPYLNFRDKVFKHREQFTNLINMLVMEGKKVIGYGASTKGNVLLQFCGLTNQQIPFIAEINSDKYGSYTPGTNIPIISEVEARNLHPDFFLVLPWHFKQTIIERERTFLTEGGKFIFPLPEIEIV